MRGLREDQGTNETFPGFPPHEQNSWSASRVNPRALLREAAWNLAPAFLLRHRISRRFAHEVDVAGEMELAMLDRWIKPGDLLLDVGAHHGVYAWQAQRLGARVIAFEPNPLSLKRLRAICGNSLEVRGAAVSDRVGSARMSVPRSVTELSTLRPDAQADAEAFEVPTITIDSLGIGPVAFIKIDVEGHEEQVLAGARQTLWRDLPVLLVEIEERHNPGGLARICELTASMGYTTWFLRDGAWQSLSNFDAGRDQDERELDKLDAGVNRRDVRYFNNFLFLPPKGGANSTQLSSRLE